VIPAAGSIIGGTDVSVFANIFPKTFLKARSCLFGPIAVEAKLVTAGNIV
jgi:hypothetical protein